MTWTFRSTWSATLYRPPVSQVRYLETLEERAQPSATPTVDLTTAGAQGTVNGAIFSQSQLSNTGTLNEFLCIHTHQSECDESEDDGSCDDGSNHGSCDDGSDSPSGDGGRKDRGSCGDHGERDKHQGGWGHDHRHHNRSGACDDGGDGEQESGSCDSRRDGQDGNHNSEDRYLDSGEDHGHGRYHQHGSSVEQGYNTDARPVPLDDEGGSSTHSIRLSDVPVVTINGVAYREFVLEVNQDSASPLLSLDQLQIYLGGKGDLTGYNAHTGKLAGLSPIYQMNKACGHNWVELNGALQHAAGTGSAYIYIPDALFKTTTDNPNPYVYLYSKFGVHEEANGGEECWSVAQPPVTLASLSGYVYADNNNNGIRDPGEPGIAGVTMTLTDANGTVVATTITDTNGAYSFTDLQPGTYTITEGPAPRGFRDGKITPGTVNGSVDGTVGPHSIIGIVLATGQAGIEYDFGELQGG